MEEAQEMNETGPLFSLAPCSNKMEDNSPYATHQIHNDESPLSTTGPRRSNLMTAFRSKMEDPADKPVLSRAVTVDADDEETPASKEPLLKRKEDAAIIRRTVTADEEYPEEDGSKTKPLLLSPQMKHPFHQTTTTLSTFIANRQYTEALRHLVHHPNEISQWVQLTQDGMFYSRLPLHMACGNLATESELTSRFQLEQLILRLVAHYPEACALVDYNNHLPLHDAIWNSATPETVSFLLMADPTSLYQRDPCGRNAAEVNRHHCGVFKDQIHELLARGMEYWEMARQERWGQEPLTRGLVSSKGKLAEQASVIGSLCIATHGEISAYDSSLTIEESDSVFSDATMAQIQPESTDILQLEETAAEEKPQMDQCILQNMLNELLQQNKQLSSTIQELAKTNAQLQRTETADNTALPQQTHSPEDHSPQTPASKGDLPCSKEVIALRAQNRALKQKCGKLKARKNKQSEKIEFLKSLLASEDVLVDISDCHSESTFSLQSAGMAQLEQYCDDSAKDYDSFSIESCQTSSILSTAKSKHQDVQISCLAAYRFKAYVSSIQQRIATKNNTETKGVSKPMVDDNLEDIFGRAAELYSDHVKECSWRTGKLILQWEAPPAPSLQSGKAPTSNDDIRDSWVPPPRYTVGQVHVETGSIVSYEETSLSSMGMLSLGNRRNCWI